LTCSPQVQDDRFVTYTQILNELTKAKEHELPTNKRSKL